MPVLLSASQVLISGIKELRVPANRNDRCVLLVLIQQRRDSDGGRRNSRADWPELRNYCFKVEIFELGAKIALPKTRRPNRVAQKAPNAPPGKMLRLTQPHASVR